MEKLTVNDILKIAQPIFDAIDEVNKLKELENMLRKDTSKFPVGGMKLFDSETDSPFLGIEEPVIPSYMKMMTEKPTTIYFANGSSITFPKEGSTIINHGYNDQSI